jgi:transcription antitermination factor NusG
MARASNKRVPRAARAGAQAADPVGGDSGASLPAKRATGRPTGRKRYRPKGWTPLSDWVLVRTKVNRENYARLNCEKQGMETWLPRTHGGPGRGKLVPVFPGYLFVRPGDRWARLRGTYGVVDVVGVAGEPTFVPKAVLKALRKFESPDGVYVFPDERQPKPGEVVEIQIGPWKSHFGVYNGTTAQGRLKVLLEFMSQPIVLEFSRQRSIRVRDDVKLI